MKRNLFLSGIGVILMLLAFTGCEKDKEKPLSETILGKWEVTKQDYKLYINNGLFQDTTMVFASNEMAVEFKSGGSGNLFIDGDLEGFFSWSVSGNTLSMTFPGEDPDEFKLAYNEKTKTMTLTQTESWTEDNLNYKLEMIITAKRI